MKRIAALVFTILFVSMSAPAANMSNEEKIVRLTYAKTAYAVEIGSVQLYIGPKNRGTDAAELRQRLANEHLQFELNNFSVGNISELATRPYSSLVTKLGLGDEINIIIRDKTVGEHDAPISEVHANASWASGRDSQENWDVPAKTVFDAMENHEWYTRYASFEVTVTMGGRSRAYRALFLFGIDSSKQKVIALDNITNNSSLTFFVDRDVHPNTLLKTRLRNNPAVQDWLRNQSNSDLACQNRKGETCCAPATLKCSLAKDEVDSGLNGIPISEAKPRSRLPSLSADNFFAAQRASSFRRLKVGGTSANLSYSCSDHNTQSGGHSGSIFGYEDHSAGSHELYWSTEDACEYSPDDWEGCTATAEVWPDYGGARETNEVTQSGVCHQPGAVVTENNQTGDTNAYACASVAGAVKQCSLCSCVVTVTWNSSTCTGVFPSGTLWTAENDFYISCNTDFVSSPIIIDIGGLGYQFTSAEQGVDFDIKAQGHPVRTAWTAANSQNAFLALDRNHNGLIDSGAELFGDHTSQKASKAPNGFLALAEFDKSENGGNGDGIIDEKDAVWKDLRLWVDSNHDGVSQPEELKTMASAGISSISLKYEVSRKKDQYGNQFRFKGRINPDRPGSEVKHVIYDVFLVEERP